MRTSNKILLGLLLATIFLFTSLFSAVRIKYANGSIVKDYEEEVPNKNAEQPVKGDVKIVSLYMVNDVTIIPSDSLKLKIWDNENGKVKYSLKDGVLYIGADTAGLPAGNTITSVNHHIELFLPAIDSIHAFGSRININRGADSGKAAPSFTFQLDVSSLNVNNVAFNHDNPSLYGRISVKASAGSEVRFNNGVRIEEANLRLSGTDFEEDCSINKLSIQTDSTTSLKIKGANLRKAIITSTE